MSIFDHYKILLEGVFFEKIEPYPTFHYLRSVFPQQWYNLIEPTVAFDELDVEACLHIIHREEDRSVSWYIHQHLLPSYESFLKEVRATQQADEVYLVKTLSSQKETKQPAYTEVTRDTFDDYVAMVGECFPGYDNNLEYCRHYFDITKLHNPTDSHIFNYNITIPGAEEKAVAFGSILLSDTLKTGYLHNLGTLPEHRHKGYFLKTIEALEYLAGKHGVETIFANAEFDGASYYGFKKGGYQEDSRYLLFAQE